MAQPLEWENKNALLVQGSVAVSNEIKTAPGGVPKWIRDATPNNSDKHIVVPANKLWVLKSAYVNLISGASVGSRSVGLFIKNGASDIVMVISSGSSQAASSNVHYVFGPSLPIDTTPPYCSIGMPEMLLPAGYKVNVKDISGAVPANEDTFSVALNVIEYDA